MEGPIAKRLVEIYQQDDLNELINQQMNDLFGGESPRPVSYSRLKHFLTSPRHMWESYFGEDTGSTSSLDKGNIFELMLLEPDRVDEAIVIYPIYNLRKPADREKKLQFEEEQRAKNPDVLLVKEEDLEEAFNMYRAACKHPDVLAFLDETAAIQETIYWTDPKSGIRCTGKVDQRTSFDENPFKITDLKTGVSADPRDWPRAVMNFDYWLQGGAYVEGYSRSQFVYGDYYWLVIENKAPYGVNYVKADAALIDEGRRVWQTACMAIKYCIENELWHQSHEFWRGMTPHDTARLMFYRSKI